MFISDKEDLYFMLDEGEKSLFSQQKKTEDECYRYAWPFFYTFSRFEYALKCKGYAKKGRNDQVIVDWKKFACDHNEIFLENKQKLKESLDYYSKNPPKKQIFNNNKLEWNDLKKFNASSDCEFYWFLKAVKHVRNNLFHGGKYPYDLNRDSCLLHHGKKILDICLKFDHEIEKYFSRGK